MSRIIATRGMSIEDRLLHYLPTREDGQCWLWAGTINPAGYGIFSMKVEGRLRQFRAHRMAYEHWIGPILTDLTLDHLCRTRSCCNPAHLEPVSSGENVRRGQGAAMLNAHKELCVRGHEFDLIRRVGDKEYRDCSLCRLERGRKSDGYSGVGKGRWNASRQPNGRFI